MYIVFCRRQTVALACWRFCQIFLSFIFYFIINHFLFFSCSWWFMFITKNVDHWMLHLTCLCVGLFPFCLWQKCIHIYISSTSLWQRAAFQILRSTNSVGPGILASLGYYVQRFKTWEFTHRFLRVSKGMTDKATLKSLTHLAWVYLPFSFFSCNPTFFPQPNYYLIDPIFCFF